MEAQIYGCARYNFGMNWVRILGLLPIIPAIAASAAPALPRPDAPDRAAPFVRSPAPTVAALVREVQGDPGARTRYARFFHVPPAKIAAYLQATLHPGLLAGTGNYTVYFVSQNGLVYPVWLTLPAGARVFATQDGTPTLLCNSGDPLMPTLRLPPAPVVPSVTVSAVPPPKKP